MTNNSYWYLENIDLHNILCPTKVGNSSMEQSTRVFKKGTNIYLPQDDADKIFLIDKGRVKIGVYGVGGKEIIKTILGKGEVFGELALLGQDSRNEFAYAMEETSVCASTIEEMKSLMLENSPFQNFIMKVIGKRIVTVEKRLESLVFKDSRSRIVEYLVELANTRGQRVGYELLVRKFNTHQEIANLTSTSRQTVTTILNELRSKNILTFDRKRLLIRDMDVLMKEATNITKP